MEAKEFLNRIKKDILNHRVIEHPFWDRFAEGKFRPEGLRRFALQYYLHVLRTRLYDAMVLSRTPDEKIQGALAGILWDEYGRGNSEKTHPEQFRKFLRALGLREADWTTVTPLPEFEVYADVHFRLCQDYDIWTGLGVVGLAMEYPIPVLYEKLVRGFQKAGIPDDALEFFLEHIPTDEVHSSLMENALSPHLDQEPHQLLVRQGCQRSLDVRYLLMDGMSRVTFG